MIGYKVDTFHKTAVEVHLRYHEFINTIDTTTIFLQAGSVVVYDGTKSYSLQDHNNVNVENKNVKIVSLADHSSVLLLKQ